MSEPIKIESLLVDGHPDGLTLTRIEGWTGLVFSAPRSQVSRLVARQELLESGVYLLVGEEPDNPLKSAMYVGESDNVANRLRQHFKDEAKDFAQRFVAVTTVDRTLSKTSIKALEARLVRWAQAGQNIVVKNSTLPSQPVLGEFEQGGITSFFDRTVVCLHQLGIWWPNAAAGHDEISAEEVAEATAKAVLMEEPERTGSSEGHLTTMPSPVDDLLPPWFVFEIGKAKARGRPQGTGFIVQKGSTALVDGSSTVKRDLAYRNNLVEDDVLVATDDPDLYRFAVDHVFNSPSQAGGVIKNGNCSGRVAWKISGTNTSLRDWEINQVEPTVG